MDNTSSDEVTKVVGLKIKTGGKGMLLVFANLDTCGILRHGMSVNAGVTLADNHWCMDIAVSTLC